MKKVNIKREGVRRKVLGKGKMGMEEKRDIELNRYIDSFKLYLNDNDN